LEVEKPTDEGPPPLTTIKVVENTIAFTYL